MATQAKVIIKGENNISAAVKSASNDLNALKGSVEKIGSVLKTAFSVTAIVTAIKGIGTAAKTVMTEDFGMAERAYRQLALALKDQSAYDSVVDNINNPQEAVVYDPNHSEKARCNCPQQITGFEYQIMAAEEAISKGWTESPFMPHHETIQIMEILDTLLKEWNITLG